MTSVLEADDMAREEKMTPADLHRTATLRWRRWLVLALNLASLAALTWAVVTVFGGDGWSLTDYVIIGSFVIGGPWTVMGFWNALIGLWLLHGRRNGLGAVSPFMPAGDSDAPIRSKTAVIMAIRNEDADRALTRLAEIRRSLDATNWGDRYDFFVLSDSSEPDMIVEEEAAFARLRQALGGDRVIYRRRTQNTGFKAGNVRDFVERWGDGYEFFLPLDSDSLMSGETIVRMTRICEAHPKLGILQSLVVGAPAESAFARMFQFGMRHGMRSFTMGAAWWHGDCGPFWGHNALVRTAPFCDHCELPVLPGKPPLGGHVLSHDQIEAAFMRRAGYEVRVIPVESDSWEDNPPTLQDFTKRDLRWCQGNMQYWRFLIAPGLPLMSRFQIFAAIMMYLGAPAWMAMITAATLKVFEPAGSGQMDLGLAISLFFIMMSVSLTPKIAGVLDIAFQKGGVRRYGGPVRFVSGVLVEVLFSILIAPVVAFRVTLFLVGLLFGKAVTWNGQNRDVRRLSWRDAAVGLWPQMLFGLSIGAIIATHAPMALPWAAPVLLGLVFAIPLAVLTASPAFGRWTQRRLLCAVPEELSPRESLDRISRPVETPPAARTKPAPYRGAATAPTL